MYSKYKYHTLYKFYIVFVKGFLQVVRDTAKDTFWQFVTIKNFAYSVQRGIHAGGINTMQVALSQYNTANRDVVYHRMRKTVL